jgi:cell fate regulator YaaT (PSP1 superfamily)
MVMLKQYLIRVGVMGRVGRFESADASRFARGADVVVRTQRGLELGKVLAIDATATHFVAADGTVLRRMTVEDRLLAQRLERDRHEAYNACAARLAQRGDPATLIDVEHLFDGQSLYFYFLGEVSPATEFLTAELAELYSAAVKFDQFTETLVHGCGPHCGTEEAEGAGCGSSCISCAVASACGTNKR